MRNEEFSSTRGSSCRKFSQRKFIVKKYEKQTTCFCVVSGNNANLLGLRPEAIFFLLLQEKSPISLSQISTVPIFIEQTAG